MKKKKVSGGKLFLQALFIFTIIGLSISFIAKNSDKIGPAISINGFVVETGNAIKGITGLAQGCGTCSTCLPNGQLKIEAKCWVSGGSCCCSCTGAGQTLSRYCELNGEIIEQTVTSGYYTSYGSCGNCLWPKFPDCEEIGGRIVDPSELLVVTLKSPVNWFIGEDTLLTFTCNASSSSGLESISLYTDIFGSWQVYDTRIISGNAYSSSWTINNLVGGNYNWNCFAVDGSGREAWGTSNFSLKINHAPIVDIDMPEAMSYYNTGNSIDLRYSASDDENVESCWYVLDSGSDIALGGDLDWNKTIGGTGDDSGSNVFVDSESNIYLAGSSAGKALMVKYNSSLGLEWSRVLTSRTVRDVVALNGDAYFTGEIDTSIFTSNYDLLLRRIGKDKILEDEWEKTINYGAVDRGKGIAKDSKGNIYITGGGDMGSLLQHNLVLLKYYPNGTLTWGRNISKTRYLVEQGADIAIDSSDNVYVAGVKNQKPNANVLYSNQYKGWLLKYDFNGDLIWNKTIGIENNYTDLRGVAVDGFGNVYVVGNVLPASNNDIIILKYNGNGDLIWNKNFAGAGNEYANGISVDNLGNVYVVGYKAVDGDVDLLFLKYDADGDLIWNKTIGGLKQDVGNGVFADSEGVYLIGYTDSFGAGKKDLWLIKYGGECKNITLSDLGYGTHHLTVYAIDNSGLIGQDSVDFSLVNDNAPSVNLIEPADSSSTYLRTFNMSCSASDDSLVDNITLVLWNSAGSEVLRDGVDIFSASGNFETEAANLEIGDYVWNCFAYDNISQFAWAENNFSFSILEDAVDPVYSDIIVLPNSPTVYVPGQNYYFNITWIDNVGIDSASLVVDGVIYSMNHDGNEYYSILTNLPAGNHSYYFVANDTSGNEVTTQVEQYVINRAVIDPNDPSFMSLLLNDVNSDLSVVYPEMVNASAASSFDFILYRDGIDVTVLNNQFEDLGAGVYNFTLFVAESENYTSASLTRFATVNKGVINITDPTNPLSLTLLLNDVASDLGVVYPEQINASARTGVGGLVLYRNSEDVTGMNNQFEDLGAGNYNFTAYVPESENYTSATISRFASVNQGNINPGQPGNLSISIMPDSNVDFNTETTVTGLNCPAQLVCELFRNGILVSNPETISLGAGNYYYVYNTSGNENYTAASVSENLVVNKISSVTSVLVDPASPIQYGEESNFSCFNSAGLEIMMGINGEDKTSEMGIMIIRPAGNYVINCSVAENQNYTESSDQIDYVIAKEIVNAELVFDKTSPITYGESLNASCSGGENVALIRDGVDVTGENSQPVVLGAGTYIYNCTIPSNENTTYIEAVASFTINRGTIDPNDPSFMSLLLNDVNSDLSVVYPEMVNASAASSFDFILYRDGIDVTVLNNQFEDLGAGNYNFTVFVAESQNYTSATISRFAIVNKGIIDPYNPSNPLELSLLLNDAADNVSVIYPEQINASARGNVLGLALYRNSVDVTGMNHQFALLEAGFYNFTAYVPESENYTSATISRFGDVSLETIPPVLIINSPGNETYNSSSVEINVSANENLSWCGFSLDSQSEVTMVRLSGNEFWYILLSLIDGGHNIVIRCNDTSGNENSSEVWFGVDTSFTTLDTNPPQVVLISPADGYATTSTALDFQFNATDNGEFANCSVFIDGVFTMVNSTTIINSQINVISSSISVGNHSWGISCTDVSNNIGTSAGGWGIVINAAPFCGDGSCNGGEDCSSCPEDCGNCGGGGGGGGSESLYVYPDDGIGINRTCYDECSWGNNIKECVDEKTIGTKKCGENDDDTCREYEDYIYQGCEDGFVCMNGGCIEKSEISTLPGEKIGILSPSERIYWLLLIAVLIIVISYIMYKKKQKEGAVIVKGIKKKRK